MLRFVLELETFFTVIAKVPECDSEHPSGADPAEITEVTP